MKDSMSVFEILREYWCFPTREHTNLLKQINKIATSFITAKCDFKNYWKILKVQSIRLHVLFHAKNYSSM
jgi:hypothetical protein